METRRWPNPSQPQTLQIAVVLLYISAVFGVLLGQVGFIFPIGVLLVVGEAAAGFGIANDRRWGYVLGVTISVLGLVPFALVLVDDGLGVAFDINLLLALMFPLARFALLVHPTSRNYQRIWFH